jgi:hypothetical protein
MAVLSQWLRSIGDLVDARTPSNRRVWHDSLSAISAYRNKIELKAVLPMQASPHSVSIGGIHPSSSEATSFQEKLY